MVHPLLRINYISASYISVIYIIDYFTLFVNISIRFIKTNGYYHSLIVSVIAILYVLRRGVGRSNGGNERKHNNNSK